MLNLNRQKKKKEHEENDLVFFTTVLQYLQKPATFD